MTYNEIINDLRECYLGQITLGREAISLIKQQRAEIERQKELREGWKTEAYKLAAEKDELYCNAVERVKTAKAEARKECAKEICEEIIKRFDYLLTYPPIGATTTSAKDFLEAHLPYVINSILKGITEDAGK